MSYGFEAKVNNGEVVCRNCNGVFHIDEPKCPYCGVINPAGAEKEYMEKLYDIKEDTEDLAEVARDEVEEGLKHHSKRIIKFVAIALFIVAAILILFNRFINNEEDMAVREYRAREAFRENYFGQLNKLYDEEKDDELLEYSFSLIEEPGYDAIYNWEHYGYLDAYYAYTDMKMCEELYKKSGELDDLAFAVYSAIDLTRDTYTPYRPETSYTERDLEKIEGFREYAEDFLNKNLDMTTEELDHWVSELKGDKGYIEINALIKRLKEDFQ